jgi:hypothetical protein
LNLDEAEEKKYYQIVLVDGVTIIQTAFNSKIYVACRLFCALLESSLASGHPEIGELLKYVVGRKDFTGVGSFKKLTPSLTQSDRDREYVRMLCMHSYHV